MVYARILSRDAGDAADIANDLIDVLQEMEVEPGRALTALMIATVKYSLVTPDPEQALNECADMLDIAILEEL